MVANFTFTLLRLKCVRNSSNISTSFILWKASWDFSVQFNLFFFSIVNLAGHTNHAYYLYKLGNNLLSPRTFVILQYLWSFALIICPKHLIFDKWNSHLSTLNLKKIRQFFKYFFHMKDEAAQIFHKYVV